ncbi:MAG: DUF29 domain-containing protein [Coleofasciculus sp. C1-SOL-03]|uniref:DUF29 domain-containing protein n=1 Tax=Coleofasciculus sp. C1-SOL-03 TaxID=3069522 RepID=UPI0033033719
MRYKTDYYQWIQETINQLRERNFNQVDWNNLIEELESMGKSERRAVLSLLTRLLEHLLKLSYWEAEKEYSGNLMAAEIVNFRAQIQQRLEDSPSLKPELDAMYAKAYPVAIKSVSKLFPLPKDAQISLEQALDEDWFVVDESGES